MDFDLFVIGGGSAGVRCARISAGHGARVVIAEDQTQVDKLREYRDEVPAVEKIVVIDGEGDGDWVMTLDDLEARQIPENVGQHRIAARDEGVIRWAYERSLGGWKSR